MIDDHSETWPVARAMAIFRSLTVLDRGKSLIARDSPELELISSTTTKFCAVWAMLGKDENVFECPKQKALVSETRAGGIEE